MRIRTNNHLPDPLPPNIIFDLGGVLINLDQSLTETALREMLGEKPYIKLRRKAASEKVFERFETGELMPMDIRDFFRQAGTSFDNYKFDTIWNAMLLDFPRARIRLLQRLKKKHKTFLLSNTNITHMAHIQVELQKQHNFGSLDWLFDEVFLSYEMGDRKPSKSIFSSVLSKHGLDPADTLFIDDSVENIRTAMAMGLQTFHLKVDEGQRIEDFFPID